MVSHLLSGLRGGKAKAKEDAKADKDKGMTGKGKAPSAKSPDKKEGSNTRPNTLDIGKLEGDASETLVGYCNLSENLEPCEWAFSKPKKGDAKSPLMRVLF